MARRSYGDQLYRSTSRGCDHDGGAEVEDFGGETQNTVDEVGSRPAQSLLVAVVAFVDVLIVNIERK